MKPLERIGRAEVPGGGGVMELLRRGDWFTIQVDGRQLMSSNAHGSEDALAERSCARIRYRDDPHLLIGGLGMGFTLAAALRCLGPAARLVVAELVPEVVAWSRGPLGAVAGHPLDDPRVVVRTVDVGEVIREAAADSDARFDAVLLDVDNGPEGLSRASNGWLYGRAGLGALFRALRPHGVAAVWSAAPHATFNRRLASVGFSVEEEIVRAHGRKGERHTIWFATRPPGVRG